MLAQLGERLPCKQEVGGSIPLRSTKARQGSRMSGTCGAVRASCGKDVYAPATRALHLSETALFVGIKLSGGSRPSIFGQAPKPPDFQKEGKEEGSEPRKKL